MSGCPRRRGASTAAAPNCWHGPRRVVAARGRERRERVELAERVEPAAARASRSCARQRSSAKRTWKSHSVNAWIGKVQHGRAAPQLAEAEDAIEPAHARRRRDARRPTGARAAPCSRATLERPPVTACSKMRGVAAERILPAAGAIEGLLNAIGGRKRQDESGDERNRPERQRHHARGMRRDEHPHRDAEREHHAAQAAARCGQRRPGLRPRRENDRSRAGARRRRGRRAPRAARASRPAPRARTVAACRAMTSSRGARLRAATSRASCARVGSRRDRATGRATRGRRDPGRRAYG